MPLIHDRNNPEMRSQCPISAILDRLGDKWTLLIIRDMMFFEKKRFGDFTDSAESIPSNILPNRLKAMQETGLIEARPYQDNPPRYEYYLTTAGQALRPVLFEMIMWGATHVPGTFKPTFEQIEMMKNAIKK